MPILMALLSFAMLVNASVHTSDCNYLPRPTDADTVTGAGLIAWYGGPTTRYGHGVLGDAIEATTLYVQNKGSERCALSVTLNDDSVFEDITPRIADVTGDGIEDIIAIESHSNYGASLAIYSVKDGLFTKVTSTPYIGTRYRWLAPIGTTDFNGDGVHDVALIQTPHLAGILQVWTFIQSEPQLLASKPGFSNHKIGENFITGGVARCDGEPRMVVPDINWSSTMIVTFSEHNLTATRVADDTRTTTIAGYLQCQ